MASSVSPKIQVNVGAAVAVTSTAKVFDPISTSTVTIRLLKCVVSGDTDGVYQLQDGSGGTTVAAVYLAAKTSAVLDFTIPSGHLGLEFVNGSVARAGKTLTAGNSLYAVGPSGGKITVTAVTIEE
jgi:hypothetical protein